MADRFKIIMYGQTYKEQNQLAARDVLSFHQLPFEIRNIIYRYTLSPSTPIKNLPNVKHSIFKLTAGNVFRHQRSSECSSFLNTGYIVTEGFRRHPYGRPGWRP